MRKLLIAVSIAALFGCGSGGDSTWTQASESPQGSPSDSSSDSSSGPSTPHESTDGASSSETGNSQPAPPNGSSGGGNGESTSPPSNESLNGAPNTSGPAPDSGLTTEPATPPHATPACGYDDPWCANGPPTAARPLPPDCGMPCHLEALTRMQGAYRMDNWGTPENVEPAWLIARRYPGATMIRITYGFTPDGSPSLDTMVPGYEFSVGAGNGHVWVFGDWAGLVDLMHGNAAASWLRDSGALVAEGDHERTCVRRRYDQNPYGTTMGFCRLADGSLELESDRGRHGPGGWRSASAPQAVALERAPGEVR